MLPQVYASTKSDMTADLKLQFGNMHGSLFFLKIVHTV